MKPKRMNIDIDAFMVLDVVTVQVFTENTMRELDRLHFFGWEAFIRWLGTTLDTHNVRMLCVGHSIVQSNGNRVAW